MSFRAGLAWMVSLVLLCLWGCSPMSTVVLYDEDGSEDGDVTPDGDDEDGDVEPDGDVPPDGDEPDGDTEDGDVVDGDEPVDPDQWPEQAVARVVYDLFGPTSRQNPEPYNRLPFPYNFFTRSDASTRTGLRVDLKEPPAREIKIVNSNLIDYGANLMRVDRYLDAINTMDGFSAFGYFFAEVTPDVDEAGLPATPEDSVKDESLVWLVDITVDTPQFGSRIPVWVTRKEALDYDKGIQYDPENPDSYTYLFTYLAVRPSLPLDEQHTYALVIRRGLTTPTGLPLSPSTNFLAVSGQIAIPADLPAALGNAALLEAERARFAPVLDLLAQEAIGLAAGDLLLAVDMTVQSITHTMREIERRYEANEQAPEPDFDTDDDGEPNMFTETERHPTGREGFPSFSMDFTHIGGYVRGVFKVIDWRLPYGVDWNPHRRRAIEYDAQGNPVNQAVIEVPFWLFFPRDMAKQPYPVVVAQHGINSRKEAVIKLASEYAEQGWAFVTMDFPYHGEREVGFAPLEFIDIAYPLKARSSFMQAAADHIQLIRMLSSWSGDIYPAGGDGNVDLDATRVSYVGNSLGGIVGGITLPVSRHLPGAVVNVGGGGLIDYVYDFLDQYGLVVLYPDHYFRQFSTIVQTILDAGDCVNYGKMLHNPPEGWAEKSALIQESIDDETVPNVVSENLARAFALPHLEPVVRPVYGLVPTEGPVPRFGFLQFDPATHDSIWYNPATDPTTWKMREQIRHFLRTQFETGTAEIISPTP